MYTFPDDLRKAYESSPLSFVFFENENGKAVPVFASNGFCQNTGHSQSEVLEWLESRMFDGIHPDDAGAVKKISDDFLNKRSGYDIVFRSRINPDVSNLGSGKEEYAEIHGLGKWQTMPDGTELMVILYSDISATQKLFHERIETDSLLASDHFYTDPLTGLPNVNYLHEFGNGKISEIQKENKTPCIVYIDVNSMRSYNNNYGYKEGDALLCLVANVLVKQFPSSLVVRDSEDHFVILSYIDNKDFFANKLSEANNIIRSTAKGTTSGICSGVCILDDNTAFVNALDRAKYALKQIENNMNEHVAFFSKDSNNSYFEERYIIENLERAMQKNHIRVFYQALCRAQSRKVAAFEGLARWIDPDRGVIYPGTFIPALQKYHLLHKLDLYIFEQVCKEVRIRFDNNLTLVPVSVNFSMQDFDYNDIVSEMNRIYDKYNLDELVDKSCFIVEITEQDLAIGKERLKEQLNKIRDNGYRVWLDDFGSGYSALNVFSQFDFDLVKFDMDFLLNLDTKNGINRNILKGLVQLSREFGIHTLIEGVETEQQYGFVKEIGCELAQGYYFHKPESLNETLARIRSGGVAKDCETKEEREEYRRLWTNKSK